MMDENLVADAKLVVGIPCILLIRYPPTRCKAKSVFRMELLHKSHLLPRIQGPKPPSRPQERLSPQMPLPYESSRRRGSRGNAAPIS